MQEISVDQLAIAVADGARLVDVREPGEFALGHVPGAVNIPMGRLASHLPELADDLGGRPVHLVCATGNRSAVMAEVLAEAGLPAINVVGGTRAWIDSGRAVAR